MVSDARPQRPQLNKPKPAGWHSGQTTHVAAPFGPEMVSDTRPQRNRQVLPPRSDYDFIPPEMSLFSVEMVAGVKPDRARFPFAAKAGWAVSQITFDAAPFSMEMVAGARLDQPRLPFMAKPGWSSSQLTHVAAPFSVEMALGAHPDLPRLPFGAKVGWSVSQPTHTAAPLSVEMLAGWHSDTPRLPFMGPKVGWAVSQTTHEAAPFSVEMAAGWQPPSPRLPFAAKAGWLAFFPQPYDPPPESHIGWHPDTPRLWRYFPQGQQLSQPTHVSAPISVEMLAGWQPPQPRPPFVAKAGWFGFFPQPYDAPPESHIGWHPDSPRIWRFFPQGQQLSQPTHTAAPFSVEMIMGAPQNRPRRSRGCQQDGYQVSVLVDVPPPAGSSGTRLLMGVGS